MKSLIAFIIFFAGFHAHADELSLFGGVNSTEYDSDAGSWDRRFGWEFGASYVKPVKDKMYFRTGVGIVQKNSKADHGNKFEFLFTEIPATLMYQITNDWRVFGGLNLDITLADDGAPSKTFALSLPLGARYTLNNHSSLEGYLEFGLSDFADGGTKIGNSIGFRYLYDFSMTLK